MRTEDSNILDTLLYPAQAVVNTFLNPDSAADTTEQATSGGFPALADIDPTLLMTMASTFAFIGLVIYLKELLRGPRPNEKNISDQPKEMENALVCVAALATASFVFMINPSAEKVLVVAFSFFTLGAIGLTHGIMRRPLSREEGLAALDGRVRIGVRYPAMTYGYLTGGLLLGAIGACYPAFTS